MRMMMMTTTHVGGVLLQCILLVVPQLAVGDLSGPLDGAVASTNYNPNNNNNNNNNKFFQDRYGTTSTSAPISISSKRVTSRPQEIPPLDDPRCVRCDPLYYAPLPPPSRYHHYPDYDGNVAGRPVQDYDRHYYDDEYFGPREGRPPSDHYYNSNNYFYRQPPQQDPRTRYYNERGFGYDNRGYDYRDRDYHSLDRGGGGRPWDDSGYRGGIHPDGYHQLKQPPQHPRRPDYEQQYWDSSRRNTQWNNYRNRDEYLRNRNWYHPAARPFKNRDYGHEDHTTSYLFDRTASKGDPVDTNRTVTVSSIPQDLPGSSAETLLHGPPKHSQGYSTTSIKIDAK